MGCWLISCQQQVSKEELVNYLHDPDHGLLVERNKGTYALAATYIPSDLIVLQELTRQQERHGKKVNLQKSENTHYVSLTISDAGKEIFNRFAQQTEQFALLTDHVAYQMDHYAYFRSSETDSIPLVSFNSPLTYGMNDRTKMLFSFSDPSLEESDWLELVVSEFGLGIGQQRFRFNVNQLQKIPSLNFKLSTDEQTGDLL